MQKLLIANRGEIACRIMKTAKRLGIMTVAIYADPDADALFVQLADEAYPLHGSHSRETYLSIEKILTIAKNATVDAIHPGYGFLSENAAFAAACLENNIIFVGPSPETIHNMASKANAKRIMAAAGVPIIPAYYGKAQSLAVLKEKANDLGFPLLIKAVHGGGGKGMRLVREEKDFVSALSACQEEAMASFANNEVLLERYFEKARHIETQIIADQKAGIAFLGERDCSVQRHHQKLIEEAPAPGLSAALQQTLRDLSLKAARSINYLNAGTLEFLFAEQKFYFMEMNTRLQVEHPVTEMLTGLDVVEWQLLVAMGEALPEALLSASFQGHAIEARIYAEDPAADFLPSTGKIFALRWPEKSSQLRIDTGIQPGTEITPYYDAMLAKIIVHAASRQEAITQLIESLMQVQIAGLTTNIPYLCEILRTPAFLAEALSTRFLDSYNIVLKDESTQAIILAVLFLFFSHEDLSSNAALWFKIPYFRLNSVCSKTYSLHDTRQHKWEITVHFKENHLFVQWNDMVFSCILQEKCADSITVNINHQSVAATVFLEAPHIFIGMGSSQYNFSLDSVNRLTKKKKLKATETVTAPLPGIINKVFVKKSQQVVAGEPLLVLEAMKMLHTITAPFAGSIHVLDCQEGCIVKEGDVLVGFK